MNATNIPTEAGTVATKFASNDFTDKRGIARRYGFTPRYVNKLMEAGMPHLKVGSRRTRFRVAATDAWLEKQYGTQRRAGVR